MIRALLLVSMVTPLVGCTSSGSDSSSALSALAAPSSAVLVTDNFTGTVAVGGSDVHTFTVATASQPVTVTMTAAGPPATISMGIGIGQMSGDTCSIFSGASAVLPASTTPQLAGTISAGSFCVAVFDAGNQLAPVDYALTVVHY